MGDVAIKKIPSVENLVDPFTKNFVEQSLWWS